VSLHDYSTKCATAIGQPTFLPFSLSASGC
jgi:hypothetical protein